MITTNLQSTFICTLLFKYSITRYLKSSFKVFISQRSIYGSQTFVTQPPKSLFKKYSAIYSLGDLNPNTFCAMLLYLLAYR